MMYTALLVQDVVHTLHIWTDGNVTVFDQTGHERLLVFLRDPKTPSRVILNSCIDDVWGEEVRLAVAPGSDGMAKLSFKMGPEHIEVWTDLEAKAFPAFPADQAKQVGFARFKSAYCEGNTLKARTEPVYKTLADIEGYVLSRRLEALEGTGRTDPSESR